MTGRLELQGLETVLCPLCGHGIDAHGVDPGGVCGVGDTDGAPCQCLMSPNGIVLLRTPPRQRRRYRAMFEAYDFTREEDGTLLATPVSWWTRRRRAVRRWVRGGIRR